MFGLFRSFASPSASSLRQQQQQQQHARSNSASRAGSGYEGASSVTPSKKRLSRQNSYGSATVDLLERPQTLELPVTPRTPVRSGLKKHSSGSTSAAYGQHHPSHQWSPVGSSSGGGTPTNPKNPAVTPPDSLSSVEEHLTAKPDSGFVSTSRVRFSPSPLEKPVIAYATDWSPTHPTGAGDPFPPPRNSQLQNRKQSSIEGKNYNFYHKS